MTTYHVGIEDLNELVKGLEQLQTDWPDIAEKAMKDAMVSTKYLQEAWRRIPKSNMARYASMAGATLAIKRRGDPNDPSQWEASLRGWEKQREKLLTDAAKGGTVARDRRERSLDRIERYGRGRLSNSILPRQDATAFHVSKTANSVTLSLSSSVEYAARIHEAEKPVEGDYWTPGKTHGWTAYGTGNKFLERPFIELQDKIARQFSANIDRELQRRGLK